MTKKSPFTHAIRVDMTPMVDLGFLLSLSFMISIFLSKPNMMKLNMPSNKISDDNVIGCFLGRNLYLIIGKDNRIFWHNKNEVDLTSDDIKEVNYGLELRELILQQRTDALDNRRFRVIIYATNEANYKNVVDALDEMAITNQQLYMLYDITSKEKQAYESKLIL